jgi:threonine synthase
MKYSYVTHLSCSKCEGTYSSKKIQQLCTCGAPLLVNYDLEELQKNFKKDQLVGRSNDLWRYHELLPLEREETIYER